MKQDTGQMTIRKLTVRLKLVGPWTAMLLAAVGCVSSPEINALPKPAAIDAEVARLMASEDVKGMALAVIDDGQVAYVAGYGKRSVERDLPYEPDTVQNAASFTKTTFAYLVLQLVDEGRIDLDRSIADYLPQPLPSYPGYTDLAGDDRWRALTPRIILNHATGFANFRSMERDRKLKFNFDPGDRYGYSGEGINLLQFVLEQGLGLDTTAEMKRRIFDRFAMSRTSMVWQAQFEEDTADGYTIDGVPRPPNRRPTPSTAGSMDTTIADQAKFWAGVMRGEGLSPKSRAELARPQRAITSARQFPTLAPSTDSRGPSIGLSAGLGVVTYRDANGLSWFKGGHMDWIGNMIVCQEARLRCVVMLSNSVRAERVYPELVSFVLGETATPWWWEYGPP
jgi:CubicO group peptidase (beta-lactamase class C family)